MPDMSSSPGRIMRRNRACRPCRVRKIKCDGRRPSCGICRSQNRECMYEQDKRQTSRVSREAIELLETRLEDVEDSVQGLQQDVTRPPPPPDRGTRASPPGSADPYPNNDSPLDSANDQPAQRAGHVSSAPDTSTLNFQNGIFNSHRRGEEIDESRLNPQENASSPAEVHALVQDEGRIAVYGPSSTFRISSSTRRLNQQPHRAGHANASRAVPQPSKEARNEDIEAARCRLFANSALELQKEWAYMSERKFDLDGLDFDTAWHLLQLHWNHHHMAYLLTYRPALMHSLATGGPYINKLLLNAIYLSAALNSDRRELYDDPNDRQSLGRRFYLRFQQLLLPELERSSIASAVGLITLGSSLVSNGQQTAGWHYSGLAYRMIVDLGLHVSTDQTGAPDCLHSSQPQIEFTDVEREMSRRVFWGAYINDKFQSLYFGRPPALTSVGIEPSRSLLDTYEELEPWAPYVDPRWPSSALSHYTPQPAYTISTFNSFVELADIMTDIIEHLYTPKVQFHSKEQILQQAEKVQRNLQSWEKSLPKHLLYDPKHDRTPPAHRFNPPMTFQMLHILLYRPFLPEGHLAHIAQDESRQRRICASAAFQIYELAKAYRQAFTLRRAPYMFSYALFSAASVIPFKPSGEEVPVNVLQKDVAAFFWTALKELQNGANFGLYKPMMIIRSLFERANLDLETIIDHRDGLGNPLPALGQQQEYLDRSGHSEVCGSLDDEQSSIGDMNFESVFRNLVSGSFDGAVNMGDLDMDEESHVLYGLFR